MPEEELSGLKGQREVLRVTNEHLWITVSDGIYGHVAGAVADTR